MDWVVALPVAAAGIGVIGTGLVKPGRWLMAQRRRPRLKLSFDGDSQPAAATMHWSDQHPLIRLSMVRLDVETVGAAPRAEGVRILVSRVLIDRDGELVQDHDVEALWGYPLAWSRTDVRNRDAEGKPALIEAGEVAQVDVVHVNELFPDQLHLDIRPRLPGDPQWLDSRKVQLELQIVGTDVKARRYTVTVELTEPWKDTTDPAQVVVDGPHVKR